MTLKLLLAGALSLAALTAATAAQNWGRLKEISLERTPCFGACPVYKVAIQRDGTLTYHGQRFVDRIGDFKATVPRSTFRKLERALGQSGYWEMKRSYDAQVTDLPTQIVQVRTNLFVKTVSEYGSFGPKELERLQDLIDEAMKGARHWRKVH